MRATTPAVMALLLMGLIAACGGSPTTPTPPVDGRPQLPTGQGSFDILSDERACTAKTPAWGFLGPRTMTAVVISSNQGWNAESTEQRFGNVRIRLTVTPANTPEWTVSGTARGLAIDLLSLLTFPNPSRVTLSGATPSDDAVLTGTYIAGLRAAFGRVTGTLTYTDNQGGVMTCTEGQWTMFSIQR